MGGLNEDVMDFARGRVAGIRSNERPMHHRSPAVIETESAICESAVFRCLFSLMARAMAASSERSVFGGGATDVVASADARQKERSVAPERLLARPGKWS
jgi:hypothetical protein